jgi:DNA excision repair protein ERCC-4
MSRAPKTLLTVLVDSREQTPPPFPEGVATERATMGEGDYSTRRLLNLARIERKNPEDFASSLTAGRERFDREVQRLRAYSFRAIIVEADLDYFISGRCRSRIHVNSILGSICSMHARYGVPTIFAHDPATAGRMIAGILRRLEEQLDAAEVAA